VVGAGEQPELAKRGEVAVDAWRGRASSFGPQKVHRLPRRQAAAPLGEQFDQPLRPHHQDAPRHADRRRQPGDDGQALKVADAFQLATDWHKKVPTDV
jgi:hypothetical protein